MKTPLFELGFPRSACYLPLPSLAAIVASAYLGRIFTWLRFDRRYVNQGPLCGRAAALKVSSSLFLGTVSLFLSLSTQTTTDLRLSLVGTNSQAPVKVNCQGLACGFGLFVLPGGKRCRVVLFPWIPDPV